MDRTDYVSALRRDGARLADAATDLGRRVPSCPGWDVAELVWHTGEVHYVWRRNVSGGLPDPHAYELPERPANEDLIEWFRAGVEETVTVLGDLDPGKPCWTWASQKNVGFIQRRMAQETAVHCWDALSAAGQDEPVERELAVDGIDELLEFMLPESPPDGVDQDIHLHTTDGPGEWSISPGNGAWRVTREHAKGAAAVRASASDLLLLLWRRKDPGDFETFGDTELLNRFLAAPGLD